MGVKDKNLGAKSNQDKFVENVPGAEGMKHDRIDAGHFIQDEQGVALAERVVQFIADMPLAAALQQPTAPCANGPPVLGDYSK
jgi:hypothetical protein